jgi:hypothetical protein
MWATVWAFGFACAVLFCLMQSIGWLFQRDESRMWQRIAEDNGSRAFAARKALVLAIEETQATLVAMQAALDELDRNKES